MQEKSLMLYYIQTQRSYTVFRLYFELKDYFYLWNNARNMIQSKTAPLPDTFGGGEEETASGTISGNRINYQ